MIPVADGWVVSDLNVGILYIFAISSLGVYGIIMGGWASNSKYPFLGALRSAAQMVSYEVSIGFVMITVLLCAGSLNLTDIVNAQRGPYGLFSWYWLPLFPDVHHLLHIGARGDQPAARSTCPKPSRNSSPASWWNTRRRPICLFMLGEYVAITVMCALTTILFLGGWLPPVDVVPFTWVPGIIWFVLKFCFVFFMFAMVKAIVPRYRYDQLMRLGWKIFLPTSLAMVVIVAAVLQFGGLAR